MLQSTQCALQRTVWYRTERRGENPQEDGGIRVLKLLNVGKALQPPIFDLLLHAMAAREGVEILILNFGARWG